MMRWLPLAFLALLVVPAGIVGLAPHPARALTPTPSATPCPTPKVPDTYYGFGCGTPTPTPTSIHTPDLVVLSMQIELETGDSCAFTSTELGVRVFIRNQGSGNAGPFAMNVNGAPQNVAGLAANTILSLWFPGYLFGSSTATVDATNTVAEHDETNNVLSALLAVPTLPPTCTPGTVTSTATPPSVGAFALDANDDSAQTPWWLIAGGACSALALLAGAWLARRADT